MAEQQFEDFVKLIDDLHSSKNQTEIEKSFFMIASHLMNKLCINAGGKQYRIVECEIYYNDGKNHKDPFLYGNDGTKATDHQKYAAKYQKKKLHWYFHYSGIDLTIGNGNEIMGGILIRAVQDSNNDLFTGPLKSCINILNNIHDNIFSSKTESLSLETRKCINVSEKMPRPYKRKGLDMKKEEKELENYPFCDRKYRYEV